MSTIGVLVFDGAEELDVAGPWEVLTASAALLERAGVPPDQVLLVAQGLEPVRCRKGMRLLPDVTFADHPPLDVVVVPGGEGTLLASADRTLLDWLAGVGAGASWVASVCTGALLLHASGLAAGKRLATHWAFEDRLAELGVEVVRDARWVADGNVVSSQGVSAGIDMAFGVVARFCGRDVAVETARYIEYPFWNG